MKIAVEGCGHGELDKIYETIAFVEKQDNIKVDLLLCCGDFQAVRNRSDLQAMAVPPKYQKMNTFYKYYSGEKTAPVLTVFIGGNHEASNYLQELPYGGWVAPNIYYLGYAGVLKFGGIRIGGLSGIYKGHDYNKGHFERPPYCESSKRSAYHIRNLEVFRLKQISRPIDIFLSHDWPCGIHKYGDVNSLLRRKKHFQEDVKKDELGSPPAMELLHKLQPTHWFSAHLHVKFAAIVEHQSENTPKKTTKFLALDKCLPRRRFLQVIDIPHEGAPPTTLELDPEWLVILKSTNHLLNVTKSNRYMPGPGSSDRWDFTVTEEKMEEIQRDFGGELSIPENFEQTAEVHHPAPSVHYRLPPAMPPQMCINPQTTLICEMLDLVNPFSVFSGQKGKLDLDLNITVGDSADNVSLDEGTYDDDPSYEDDGNRTYLDSTNPDEISLDDIGEDSDVGSPLATELSRGKLQLPECTSDQSTSSVNLYNLSMNMSTDKDEKTDAEGAGEESTTNNSVSSCTDLDKSQEDDITTSTPAKEGPSSSKKFKRRNQSMYASDQS